MFEKALHGSRRYYIWIAVLAVIIIVGVIAYIRQQIYGHGLSGMSRDMPWGLFIAQMTFIVGVAVSGVMVVIPYYLHNYKAFGKIVILSQFLAVAMVFCGIMFVIVDLGQPQRIFNVLLYATPNSIMFWDVPALLGYMLLNLVIGWTVLGAEKKGFKPPRWVKVLILVSIPFAISIRMVTAFLYAGLPGKDYWLTAIMAIRFLASAFASGPALLVLISLIIRRVTSFKVSNEAIDALAKIVCYAMLINLFAMLLEVYTAFHSGIPSHQAPFLYLFVGLEGHGSLVPLMWTAAVLAVVGVVLLLVPRFRKSLKVLPVALATIFIACYIDKGVALVLGGFVPNSFGRITEYLPTLNEAMIIGGVYALGLFLLSLLYKVVFAVRAGREGDD